MTDRGLLHLRACVALEQLELDETDGVTGESESVSVLAGLPRLRRLMLEDSQVTDRAIPQLLLLKQLQRLDVEGSRITPAGLDRLAAGLPGCRVK